jgi:hypothetical protein
MNVSRYPDNPTNGAFIMSGTAYGTIIDAPVNPMYVSIAAVSSAVLEGDSGQFTVSRSSSEGPLTVYFAAGGTAAAADYTLTPAPSAVAFADGQSTATIDVAVIDDALLEVGEYLEIELLPTAPGTSGPSQYLMIGSSTAGISFHDGDAGEMNLEFWTDWLDPDATWINSPDNEMLWQEDVLRWRPEIPPEIDAHVTGVIWQKRDHADPNAQWALLGTGTREQFAEANPGIGDWDIRFLLQYGEFSFVAAPRKNREATKVAGVTWERGKSKNPLASQYFLNLGDTTHVAPEATISTSSTQNCLRLNFTARGA